MTLYEYRLLSETEQYNVLWGNGVHISERHDGRFGYVLYQVFSFYVELKYDGEINKIADRKVFSTDRHLEPYLNKIDITKL